MKILIYWNNTIYAQQLRSFFGQATIVLSNEQLHAEMPNTATYDLIIILCELNYTTAQAVAQTQQLHGIELAKKLRLLGIKAPIIFTSFLTRKQAYNNKLDKALLIAIGHAFVQLPCLPAAFTEAACHMQPLHELELYDIVQNYCDPAGAVRSVMHSLNGLKGFDNKADTSNDITHKIITAITQVHEFFKQNAAACIAEFESNFLPLTNENINGAISFAEHAGTSLLEQFAHIHSISDKLCADRNWRILLLDDEITASHQLVTELTARNITVTCVNNAEEAKLALEKDAQTQHEIMVVVSDYRLESTELGVKLHQPIQGYRFLQELAAIDYSNNPAVPCKPFVRMVALSALPRKFLMKSFGNYGLRVEVFSKKDYLKNTSTIDLLCNNLVEIGNEQAEAVIKLPGLFSEKWALFEPFYRYHRNNNGYKQQEAYITERARLYCLGVLDNTFPFDLEGYTALNLDAEKARPDNDKYYTVFLNKLICRRVALWFMQHYKYKDLQTIHRVIRGNQYTGKETLITAKNQIYTNLALSPDDFPWNITVEEKRWLIFDMQIPGIDELEKEELAIIGKMNKLITAWITESKLKAQLIKFNIVHNDNQTIPYLPKFSSIRLFLFKLIAVVSGNSKHIAALQSLVIALQSQIPTSYVSNNVEKINAYLKLFGNRLSLVKPITNETIEISNQNIFLEDIVSQACQNMNETDKLLFYTNAYLFYNEPGINKSTLSTKAAWQQALMEFHNREMKNYYWDSFTFNESIPAGPTEIMIE